MKTHLLSLFLIVACSKTDSKPTGSPDWGDDPRPLGSCVGTVKPGVALPEGSQPTVCLEKQTKDECTRPSQQFDYVYAEHTTCASRGYDKRCDGGGYPASARFEACPANTTDGSAAAAPPSASPALEPAKQMVAIFREARRAADEAGGDCAALGKQLAPLRDKLWDLGKANPGALKSLTDAELKSIGVADAFSAIAGKLPACKDDVHAKEFAYAMTKVIDG